MNKNFEQGKDVRDLIELNKIESAANRYSFLKKQSVKKIIEKTLLGTLPRTHRA